MVETYIFPFLLLSGALTAGIIVMAVAPKAVLRLLFAFDATDVLSIFLARYVGLLVFLVGGLIVYGAFHPEVRAPVLVAATVEKIAFVAFILSGKLRRTPLGLAAAAADSCFAAVYILYLSAV
jgi:hypothetical protein